MTPPIRSCSQSDIADTLIVVEYGIIDVGVREAPSEMWKGRIFPDRPTFQKTLSKFSMYNNFVLKQIKSNKRVVSAQYAEDNFS